MYFDRFDICEAYAVYAWDWGNYVLWSRIQRMGFRARPTLSLATLTTNGRAIYDGIVSRTGTDAPF